MVLAVSEWPWRDVLPSAAAQITALTAIAIAVGWWGTRVVRWWRKLRVWSDAVAQERFAERAAQVINEAIAPRFDRLDRRLKSVEDNFQIHLDETVERRKREDAAAAERTLLFQQLREHMAKEDTRTAREENQ